MQIDNKIEKEVIEDQRAIFQEGGDKDMDVDEDLNRNVWESTLRITKGHIAKKRKQQHEELLSYIPEGKSFVVII